MTYDTSYDPDTDFDRWYTLATGAAIAEWITPGERVLEMGCATGLMTLRLSKVGARVTAVDRSDAYLDTASARDMLATFYKGDVMSFGSDDQYDHVVATNVIHELPDPAAFLRHCHAVLHPGGLLHLASQNPYSIHRLVALEMGMIDDLCEISDRGTQWGTLRLFTLDELEEMAYSAGFMPVVHEGIMLKPLPNEQMAALPDEVLEGFRLVAHRFPEHCAVNYLTLRA